MSDIGPRTLVIDIETSPIEGYFWQLFDQNIAPNQITADWSILSYSAKWLDSTKMMYADTGGRGKSKVRDDKRLTREIVELLEESDIVVGQNHKRFDLKKIHARMLLHDIPPYSPIRVVDTKIEVGRRFGVTSKRLEWLSKIYTKTKKGKHREFPGFEMWEACLADNPRAWRKCVSTTGMTYGLRRSCICAFCRGSQPTPTSRRTSRTRTLVALSAGLTRCSGVATSTASKASTRDSSARVVKAGHAANLNSSPTSSGRTCWWVRKGFFPQTPD